MSELLLKMVAFGRNHNVDIIGEAREIIFMIIFFCKENRPCISEFPSVSLSKQVFCKGNYHEYSCIGCNHR